MSAPAYAELHCLSNFSFLRGASHPAELVEQATALGYAALALTDECSVAGVVRAWEAARECGLKLVIGSEFRLEDGLRLVLLAADRAGYGRLCRLITRGRRAAPKGEYRLTRADLIDEPAEGLPGCLALWLPGDEPEEDEGRWVAAHFPGRAWLAVELFAGGDDAGRLAELEALGARLGLPLVAAGDVHMHHPQRRPLQDLVTAIRLNTPLQALGRRLFPNGERHLRARPRLARLYPPTLLVESVAIAARCNFSLDELDYHYPAELVPDGHTPSSWLRHLTQEGMARRWSDGVPETVRQTIERELGLIDELGYEAYFLTVHDIVRLRPQPGHPVPGPRLGGQLRGVLLPGHHRGRPGAHVDVVRALHLQGAQRAAGHRRGLRARTARGSHPVHLRQVRPRPRRAGRHGHQLPAAQRDARCRQGARPGAAAMRRTGAGHALVGRQRRSRRSGCAKPASIPTTR